MKKHTLDFKIRPPMSFQERILFTSLSRRKSKIWNEKKGHCLALKKTITVSSYQQSCNRDVPICLAGKLLWMSNIQVRMALGAKTRKQILISEMMAFLPVFPFYISFQALHSSISFKHCRSRPEIYIIKTHEANML